VTLKSGSEVLQGHRIRNLHRSIRATYDFLLATIGLSRIRDKRRFQSKIAKFSNAAYLTLLLTGLPMELDTDARVKNGFTTLPCRERSLTISSAVWIQYTNVTDKRTDRRTPGDSKDALTHSVAL